MTIIDSLKVPVQKILILGSLIVDEYVFVETKKLSPEAPVPVAYLKSLNPIQTPGGAGLAAAYARKHSISSALLTDCTMAGERLLSEDYSIDVENFHLASGEVRKRRYIDSNSKYHLLRVDNDHLINRYPYDIDDISYLFNLCLKDVGCLLILDYNKGLFTNQRVVDYILSTARDNKIPTYVDSRGDTKAFKGASIIKMNYKEYEIACSSFGVSPAISIEPLREEHNLEALIVSKGPEGAMIRTREQLYTSYPEVNCGNSIPDVTGCGDVLDISFCYYYYIVRLSIQEALQRAVNSASVYAFEPIDKRLKCQTSMNELN